MLRKIINLALYASGLGPVLMGLQTVFRLALIAAVIVAALLVMGIDPLAAAQSMLQDWLIPDSVF